MNRRRLILTGVLVLVWAVISACGRSEPDPVTAPPTLPSIPTDPPQPTAEAAVPAQPAVAEAPVDEVAVEESMSAGEGMPEEAAAPDIILPAGYPERPAAVDEYFRPDKPEFISATGRPQLLEFFTFW